MTRPDEPRSGLSPLVVLAALALAAAFALPAPARGGELVAEAAFLADTLPPGGRDLALSMTSSAASPELAPRAQLAIALGPRLGFTTDAGVHRFGERLALDTPCASLKLLARAPGEGRTGLSVSLDLLGSAHSLEQVETGAGVGAVRGVGPVTLRAALWGASGVTAWSPHLHGGLSAAVALGARVRVVAEAVSELARSDQTVSAGPTVKVALGDRSALAAGALVGLTPAAERATFFVQLSRSL
jgi:hypothetical protein